MSIILEISTKDYATDSVLLKKAMSQLESLCFAYGGYVLSEPKEKFGWTFFKMGLKPELQIGIEKKFSDMITRYRWSKPEEKLTKFLSDYLNVRGCQVKVSLSKD